MALLSYLGDPAVKTKYLERVRAHARADEIVKGQYWEDGKGCAVGCTIHSNKHDRYETELGMPAWLALLEDSLFENLPNGEAKAFPEQFLKAVPVGINLEPVKWQFCSYLMEENLARVETLDINDDLKKQVGDAIRQCKSLHDAAALEIGQGDESSWSAAARSASSA